MIIDSTGIEILQLLKYGYLFKMKISIIYLNKNELYLSLFFCLKEKSIYSKIYTHTNYSIELIDE